MINIHKIKVEIAEILITDNNIASRSSSSSKQ